MSPAQTREALSALVERSGLLSAARLVAYRRPGDGTEDSLELARALVRDRLLTPFQARQLLRGKYRGYFLTDKYKVLDQLGEGGMGRVLLCEHLLLQRLVAVKMLHATWVSVPGAEERFLREARAAAAVDHDNVVHVYDVDRAGGVPFMVMEFVDGTNLHQLVAEHGPLEPTRAAGYARQAAVGLGAAHDAGLVHRDIKPSNILLDRSGAVKLLDLGLARFMVDSARNHNLTAKFDAGSVLGTLDFIAPEQADDSSRADIRADIYSLGYTLYYLLTGRMPFGDGSPAQKLMWHQMRHPEPLTEIRPDLPAEFQSVFERMTQKNPADRYQAPAEVAAALAPLVGPLLLPPPAAQMPKLRASAFLLGLAPPPTREVLAAPDPHTPTVSDAETDHTPRSPRPDESGSDVLRTIDAPGTTDPLGPTPTPAPSQTISLPSRSGRRPFVAGAVTVLLAVAVALSAWQLIGPRDKPDPKPPADPPTNTLPAPAPLTGEGSSFVDPMMQRWVALYQPKTGVALKYTRSGSSAGVREFISGRVPFAGTDAYLTDAQLLEAEAAGGPVVHVPLVMGAVVATYNLPDVKQSLRFSGAVLADIYLGKITRWNDPAIESANPGVELPNLAITVVHRSDGSGTTFIWTDYLSKVSGDWRGKGGPGVGNSVKWPVGVSAVANDGVATAVSATVGAIGYVELSFALSRNLPAALVENRAGAFVAPSLKSVTAAAANRLKDVPADLRYTLTFADGKESYPISGTTWAVVYKKQLAENRALLDFLKWAVHEGQAHVAELKYAPLPPELVAKIDALLK